MSSSSAHPNTPTSNTPQPTYPNVVVVTSSSSSPAMNDSLNSSGAMDSMDGSADGEERDAFSLEVLPGKSGSSLSSSSAATAAAAANYARTGPVPVLHHFSLTPPHGGMQGHFHHCGLSQNAANHRNLPSPASQPQSLNLPPVNPNLSHVASCEVGSGGAGGGGNMSRSISDSTLRRAALHLNLNQSVLPSFTSLQQFKVCSSTE